MRVSTRREMPAVRTGWRADVARQWRRLNAFHAFHACSTLQKSVERTTDQVRRDFEGTFHTFHTFLERYRDGKHRSLRGVPPLRFHTPIKVRKSVESVPNTIDSLLDVGNRLSTLMIRRGKTVEKRGKKRGITRYLPLLLTPALARDLLAHSAEPSCPQFTPDAATSTARWWASPGAPGLPPAALPGDRR